MTRRKTSVETSGLFDSSLPSRGHGFTPATPLVSTAAIEARHYRRTPSKRDTRRALGAELVAEIVSELPEYGSSTHIISNGRYDFWQWVPHLLTLTGPARLYASTWTMNRGNALGLLDLLDSGAITSSVLLTGLYFKTRESAVAATIIKGLADRGQRYMALKNHAKVIVIEAGARSLVVEGSANFTANPRIEQYVLTRDEGLAAFHAEWMMEAVGTP